MSHMASVIVYGERDDPRVSATLTSVVRQTLSDVEVIVVAEVGSATVRREAVDAADGAYVVELNAGDILRPTMLEKCIWAIETRPRVGAAFVHASSVIECVRPLRRADVAKLSIGGGLVGVSVMRKLAWDESRGFDTVAPAAAVDGDFMLRMLKHGWAALEMTGDLILPSDAWPPQLENAARLGTLDAAVWLQSRHRAAYMGMTLGNWCRAVWVRTKRRFPVIRLSSESIAAKLEVDGLTDTAQIRLHPFVTLLRLVPQRFKTGLWIRWNLPQRPDQWEDAPQLLPLAGALDGQFLVSQSALPDERMRALVLHSYLIAGGAETVLLNLFSHIDSGRFSLHLITTELPPGTKRESPWLPRFAEQTDSIYQLCGFLEPSFRLRFLIDFINSRQIDVIVISLSIFGYNALPQIRAHCPGVTVLDLLHAEAPYVPMDHMRLASRYQALLDCRVVTTESVRSVQIEKYSEKPGRVVVIPNGVDTADAFDPARYTPGRFRQRLGIAEGVSIVLFFGRLVNEKQPIHIVEIADRLQERDDIMFVIVGVGPERSAVESEVELRGLRNVVLCPPEPNIANALIDASLVLFPSKREGLPMSGIEAMAMGVPVVASKVLGWTDLVGNGIEGILIADGDFEGYATAIVRIVDDAKLRSQMSQAGREKAVTSYDVRDCVLRWEELLDSSRTPPYGNEQ